MLKSSLALVVVLLALAGCGSSSSSGSGTGSTVDLDTKNGLWTGSQSGKVLVLYTYKGDAHTLVDVRASAKAATEGQYEGSRTGSASSGYTLDLTCLNPSSSPVCASMGKTLTLHCTPGSGKPQLVCGSLVFDAATAQDIAQ